MSKSIKILCTVLALTTVFLFASCRKAEPESVDVRTTLSINNSFSGSRVLVLTFPENIVPTGSEIDKNLDKVVQKYCPDTMSYSKNTSDNKISYTFTLAFKSIHDYISKTTDITGTQTVVTFSNPNTVMTKGWKLDESFQSTQMLSWIASGAKKETFDDLEFLFEETNTSVSFDEDTHSVSSRISINTLHGSPVQNIRITTVNKGSVYDRTIIFNISQSTFDSVSDSISAYFKSITDTAASSAEWLLENNSYLYTVKFNDISLRQLEGYTNKLLSSVYCEASYEDKSIGSTPLASQNTYTETLDFSNYISNNNSNVPVEYTYSVEGSAELGECQLYDGSYWSAATDLLSTNKYGSLVAIKNTEASVKLKISDGKQYTASSINVNVTPLDEDKIKKSVIFKYDIATGGVEASDYTKSYFDSINIEAYQAVENDKKTCTVTFTGTPSEVNTKMQSVFGSANTLSYTSYQPFMTLRTVKQFTDHIDFSSLIIGKNIDTPINYSITAQQGDLIKSFAATPIDTTDNISSSGDSSASQNIIQEDNTYATVLLSSSGADITFDISTPNISDIVLFGVISVCIIVISVIILMIFRNQKKLTTPTSSHTKTLDLPESQHKLAKKKHIRLEKTHRNQGK